MDLRIDRKYNEKFTRDFILELKKVSVLHLTVAIVLINVDTSENLFSTQRFVENQNKISQSYANSILHSVASLWNTKSWIFSDWKSNIYST